MSMFRLLDHDYWWEDAIESLYSAFAVVSGARSFPAMGRHCRVGASPEHVN